MSGGNSAPFLLDTNVFVQAHRRYYAMDICPGFWDCLAYHCKARRVLSVDQVQDEIEESDDRLREWIVKMAQKGLFASTDELKVAEAYNHIISWVNDNSQFQPSAKAEFAAGADGWIVAYAKVHGFQVVTEEVFNPHSKKRVPIPNICGVFEVSYGNTFSMLRALQVRFSLS